MSTWMRGSRLAVPRPAPARSAARRRRAPGCASADGPAQHPQQPDDAAVAWLADDGSRRSASRRPRQAAAGEVDRVDVRRPASGASPAWPRRPRCAAARSCRCPKRAVHRARARAAGRSSARQSRLRPGAAGTVERGRARTTAGAPGAYSTSTAAPEQAPCAAPSEQLGRQRRQPRPGRRRGLPERTNASRIVVTSRSRSVRGWSRPSSPARPRAGRRLAERLDLDRGLGRGRPARGRRPRRPGPGRRCRGRCGGSRPGPGCDGEICAASGRSITSFESSGGGDPQSDAQVGVGPDVRRDDTGRALGREHQVHAERATALGDVDHAVDEVRHLGGERGELVDADEQARRRRVGMVALERDQVLDAVLGPAAPPGR